MSASMSLWALESRGYIRIASDSPRTAGRLHRGNRVPRKKRGVVRVACAFHTWRQGGDDMSLINIGEPNRANPLEVVERMASTNDWSFERAGEDEIPSGPRQVDRLPGVVHLDARHRGAAPRLRLRIQGAGTLVRRN